MGGVPRPRRRPVRVPDAGPSGRLHPQQRRARPDRPPGVGHRVGGDDRRAGARRRPPVRHRRRARTGRRDARTSGPWPSWPTRSPSCIRWPRSATCRPSRRCSAAADGFALLLAPASRRSPGARARSCGTGSAPSVAKRWDEVIEALDGVVTTPDVDPDALAAAEAEAARRQRGLDRATRTRHRPGARGGRTRPRAGVLGRDRHRLHRDHRRRPHRLDACAAISRTSRSSCRRPTASRSSPPTSSWRTTSPTPAPTTSSRPWPSGPRCGRPSTAATRSSSPGPENTYQLDGLGRRAAGRSGQPSTAGSWNSRSSC